MKDFLEEYGIIIFAMIFIYILFVCTLFSSDFITSKLNNQLNIKQEQTKEKSLEQSNIKNTNVQSDNNINTKHPTHILNSMKHIFKTVGMIIGICILLIVNISLIMNDFRKYNTLLQNNRTYYFKKSTMEFHSMNIDYKNNCSIILY